MGQAAIRQMINVIALVGTFNQDFPWLWNLGKIFGNLCLKLYPGLALLIQDTQGQGGGGDQEQKHQEEVNPLDQTNIKRV